MSTDPNVFLQGLELEEDEFISEEALEELSNGGEEDEVTDE